MTRFPLFAAAALVLGSASGCGDDEDDESGPGETAEGPFAESAILVVTRVLAPDGRSIFLSIVDDLGERELDLGQALEVSGLSRARVHNGKVFIFDGERGEIARFEVTNEGDFVEEGRLSMAGLGVTRFISSTVFISEDRAQYTDTTNNQVILFDPETMEVTGNYDLPELAANGNNVRFRAPQRIGDELFSNVRWIDFQTGQFTPTVTVFVFSATEDRLLRVVTDARCGVASNSFVDGGQFYVVGEYEQGGFVLFGIPEEVPPPCLLRIGPGATEFDRDFYLDLSATVGAPFFANSFGVGDNVFAVQSYVSEVDPSTFTQTSELFGGEFWGWTLVNFETEQSQPVSGVPLTPSSPFGALFVDGELFLPVVNVSEARSTLFRVDVNAVASAGISSPGEIIGLERIR